MASLDPSLAELFKAKAAPVGTIVAETEGLDQALDYALNICRQKDNCELLLAGGDEKSVIHDGRVRRSAAKILAAPELAEARFAELAEAGAARGITVIRDGLREHLAGLEVGFSLADLAVAETATAVLACPGEEARLSAMICETHIIAVPKSKIVETSYQAEDYLRDIMGGIMYAAFISGCSRTSDIERVLTLGVHGPLELHVVLMNT
ncbi:lactate utilization protein [Deltaproteobacteria bacterium OttesenSCG-928-M10]|nr:lactate utilization protein [Deltaproteobacteria bacterium OttesenSCG-928-M10]